MWGSGTPRREFLHVDDMAEASIHVMQLERSVYEANTTDRLSHINIGTGKEITISKLIKTICTLMDFKGSIKWDTSRPNGQHCRCLDVSRAKREFGFEAKTDFEEGLKKTIDWYLKNNPT